MTEPEAREMCKTWLDVPVGRRYQIAKVLGVADGLFELNLYTSLPLEILRRVKKANKIPQFKELINGTSPLTVL